MQRKATRNTRGPNADEKRFAGWVKEHNCIQCGMPGPSIVDHMYGATFKRNKVLIGHRALLPLCVECDEVKTLGSARAYLNHFGETQAQSWVRLVEHCPFDIPQDEYEAIMDWNR